MIFGSTTGKWDIVIELPFFGVELRYELAIISELPFFWKFKHGLLTRFIHHQV